MSQLLVRYLSKMRIKGKGLLRKVSAQYLCINRNTAESQSKDSAVHHLLYALNNRTVVRNAERHRNGPTGPIISGQNVRSAL